MHFISTEKETNSYHANVKSYDTPEENIRALKFDILKGVKDHELAFTILY